MLSLLRNRTLAGRLNRYAALLIRTNRLSPDYSAAYCGRLSIMFMPCNTRRVKFAPIRVLGLMFFVCLVGLPLSASADLKGDVGYTKLVNSLNVLGIAIPNGNGVPISLVESGGNAYWPNTTHPELSAASDPLGQSTTFIDGTNLAGRTVGSHPTSMALWFFGNSLSFAPGANTVTVYEASNYLSNILHAPNGTPAGTQNFRVQNFSWVGSYDQLPNDGIPPNAQETADGIAALRRFDYVINRDNITAVVGINNNTDPLPHLLGQSYNSIAVGKTNGVHSSGLTNLTDYGPGRSKPDIVAPQSTASASTASTSSAATMLHSVVAGTDAAKSQVIKAMLMAGATKNEFPTWSRTASQPLDDTFGAGELNVFNSYLMTQGGEYAGSTGDPTLVGTHGWDYGNAQPGGGNEIKYKFVVPTGRTAPDLSILLTWNVDIPGSFTGQSLANLNMALTDSFGQTVDQSLSAVDNVEHIYLTNLAAGDYTLTISSDASRDFGLAWRMSTLSDITSADFDEDGDVDGRDFLTWQRGFGKLIDSLHADGDADGDGDVDAADLAIYQDQFTPGVIDPPPLILASVPEPGSLVLLAGGALAFLLKRRR
jgi:hypothetical protein